jgi:hypothetical protein
VGIASGTGEEFARADAANILAGPVPRQYFYTAPPSERVSFYHETGDNGELLIAANGDFSVGGQKQVLLSVVDDQGNEHFGTPNAGTPFMVQIKLTDLGFDHVREVSLKGRIYQWASFNNIAVDPKP